MINTIKRLFGLIFILLISLILLVSFNFNKINILSGQNVKDLENVKDLGNLDMKSVCIDNVCFIADVADSPKEREQGLMNRNYLEEYRGMLFIFEEEGIYSFWMKNTLIPLDMIWIDKDNKIVYIQEKASPLNEENIIPDEKALYVLEINAGMVRKYGVKVGDKVEIK